MMNYESILEELKRDHASTNDKIRGMAETIKNLEDKRDMVMSVITDAHASLNPDVNDLTLSEVKAAIDKTRSLLSSLLTKEDRHQTLGAAFFNRAEEIGFDRKVIEDILLRNGVHAVGPFVEEVLLGEKRSDTNAISFVSMHDPLDLHLEGSTGSLAISSFNGMTWRRQEYKWHVNKQVTRVIFIVNLVANPDETHQEFNARLSKMSIYDMHNAFSKIDPTKVSFDGEFFRVSNIHALLGKIHYHLASETLDQSLVDNEYGITIKECEVLPEPTPICLGKECTFSDLAAISKSDASSYDVVSKQKKESVQVFQFRHFI